MAKIVGPGGAGAGPGGWVKRLFRSQVDENLKELDQSQDRILRGIFRFQAELEAAHRDLAEARTKIQEMEQTQREMAHEMRLLEDLIMALTDLEYRVWERAIDVVKGSVTGHDPVRRYWAKELILAMKIARDNYPVVKKRRPTP
jgi:DNA repair exonuclease SbcCD ATPase subunit